MFRFVVLLPFCLGACAIRGPVPQTPAATYPPMAPQIQSTPAPALQGRWTIIEMNGKRVAGLWLEFGGEGLVTVTEVGDAIYVRSPQPQTRAYLGCNWWDASGWTRSADTLVLGREASRMTERGCDGAVQALEEEAYSLLTKPMIMAFTAPDQLRLSNESGTLRLVRERPSGMMVMSGFHPKQTLHTRALLRQRHSG
jgi:hypothetical protein